MYRYGSEKMIRVARIALIGLMAFHLGMPWQTSGDEPADDDAKIRREQTLREMRERINTVRVESRREPEPVRSTRVEEPLFRYSDEGRKIVDATLWGWTAGGRPLAVCKMEKYRFSESDIRWLYCFASLSDGPIDAAWDAGRRFAGEKPGIELRPFGKGPVPGDGPMPRLRQMKELVRRVGITINGLTVGKDQEMRLLAQPIHRYADPEAGIIDGVIFVFSTNGTNPDILVPVELHKPASDAAWRFGICWMTNGELTVRLDENEIWHADYIPFGTNLGRNLGTFTFFYD